MALWEWPAASGQLAGILHEISSKKIMGNLKNNCICRLIPLAFFLSL